MSVNGIAVLSLSTLFICRLSTTKIIFLELWYIIEIWKEKHVFKSVQNVIFCKLSWWFCKIDCIFMSFCLNSYSHLLKKLFVNQERLTTITSRELMLMPQFLCCLKKQVISFMIKTTQNYPMPNSTLQWADKLHSRWSASLIYPGN